MTVVLTSRDADPDRYSVVLGGQVDFVHSAQDLHGYLDAHPLEDLVVVGPDITMAVVTSLAQRYRVERAALGIVLLRERVETDVLREALRSGIREVVQADDVEAITVACRQSRSISGQVRGALSGQDTSRGKVIMVFGAKGGCGKTTVATNLAMALADLDVGRVALVDLDLDFGDVGVFLKLGNQVTISKAVQMAGTIDERAAQLLMTPYRDRVDVLLAPGRPAEAEFVKPELVVDIVNTLRETYAFVVLDSAPSFTEVSLQCFEIADSYVLVTTLDLPSLKNIKLAMDTMDALGYPRSKWHLVLNRANAEVGLTREEVEEVLGIAVMAAVPSSRDVPETLNTGGTIVEEMPRHPVSQAIVALARSEAGLAPVPAKRRRFWRRKR